MARTKSELATLSAARIRERNKRSLSWGTFISSLNRIAVPNRELILTAFKDGDGKTLGDLLVAEFEIIHQSDADTEATTILADDNVTLTELDRIL